MKTWSSWTI